MTLGKHEDDPYSNEYQREAVELLHKRTKRTAISAGANSEIHVYLTRSALCDNELEIGVYNIESVVPMPNSDEFECRVILRANWSEVKDAE